MRKFTIAAILLSAAFASGCESEVEEPEPLSWSEVRCGPLYCFARFDQSEAWALVLEETDVEDDDGEFTCAPDLDLDIKCIRANESESRCFAGTDGWYMPIVCESGGEAWSDGPDAWPWDEAVCEDGECFGVSGSARNRIVTEHVAVGLAPIIVQQ